MNGRMLGLILFGIGFGMVVGLLCEKCIWTLLMAAMILLMGYHLFCRR